MKLATYAKLLGALSDTGFNISDEALNAGLRLISVFGSISGERLDTIDAAQLKSLIGVTNVSLADEDIDKVASALRVFASGSNATVADFFTKGLWAHFMSGSPPPKAGDFISRCHHCGELNLPQNLLKE